MNKYLPLIFTILTIFGNYYIPILNNVSVKEISENNKYDSQPAGWTFSIWGIIYIGLLFISYKIIQQKLIWDNKRNVIFIVSCIFNLLWMYTWTKNIKQLSQILLILLVISLVYLWILNLESNDKVSQNIIMMYIAWTLGASLLNIFIVNFKNTIENSKLIIYLLSLIQIIFQILIYYNNNLKINSYSFSIVGIWTGLGILTNKSNNLGISKNLLFIVSIICTVLNIYFIKN